MAEQPVPTRRYFAASAVALAPSFAALAALYWSGNLAGRPALIAMAAIAAVTIFLVQRYLGSIARFARFVGELSDEREPVMPRLSFAPATEELATAAATLSAGWRRQRASIDNLAASAQAIVDGLPDPLIAVDRQRRIVRTNLAARTLLGPVGAERDLSTVFRQPQLLAAIDGLLETGSDGNFTGPDQTAVELVLSGPPELDMIAHLRRLPRAAADGSLALVVLHDTTALRRAERMRADFVANASHELKTPIAGLAGFIETLRGPARDDVSARERFLGIMAEQADRMRRLVDDLLMLSRNRAARACASRRRHRPRQRAEGRARPAAAEGLVAQGGARSQSRTRVAPRDRRLRRAHHRVPEPGRQRAEIRQARHHGARGGAAGWRGPGRRRRQRRGRRHSRQPSAATHRALLPRRRRPLAPAGRHRVGASPSSSTSSTATAAASTSRARPARARPSR